MKEIEGVLKRAASLESSAKRLALSSEPDRDGLFRVAMNVLAEEERLENILEGSLGEEEAQAVKEALKRVKNARKLLLRVYVAMPLRGRGGGWESVPTALKLKGWEKLG